MDEWWIMRRAIFNAKLMRFCCKSLYTLGFAWFHFVFDGSLFGKAGYISHKNEQKLLLMWLGFVVWQSHNWIVTEGGGGLIPISMFIYYFYFAIYLSLFTGLWLRIEEYNVS